MLLLSLLKNILQTQPKPVNPQVLNPKLQDWCFRFGSLEAAKVSDKYPPLKKALRNIPPIMRPPLFT